MRRFLGILCLVAGIGLIATAFGMTFHNISEEKAAGEEAVKVMELLEEEMKDIDEPNEEVPLYKLYPDMQMPTITLEGNRYIGMLEIPAANLKLPVMEVWNYTKLNIAPCRYYGSAYTNDLIIAGHDYPQHLAAIRRLPIATEVIFTDVSGNEFRYRISWTEVLNPTEVDALQNEASGNEWDLTLFTCTLSGSDRYTIRCVLEE